MVLLRVFVFLFLVRYGTEGVSGVYITNRLRRRLPFASEACLSASPSPSGSPSGSRFSTTSTLRASGSSSIGASCFWSPPTSTPACMRLDAVSMRAEPVVVDAVGSPTASTPATQVAGLLRDGAASTRRRTTRLQQPWKCECGSTSGQWMALLTKNATMKEDE